MTELVDALLIAPYRLADNAVAGFYIGTTVLALACLIVGKASLDLAWLINRRHYDKEEAEMIRMHNLSVAAIEAGDKVAYKAANKEANEAFGKSFFAGAALFSVSIWPLPFALAWLSGRFEGVDIPVAGNYAVRYNAVFLAIYIVSRFILAKYWSRVPYFGRIERLRKEAAARRTKPRSWTELGRPGV
ncbi:MAG: hypothetical protein B193_3133 [Solidesulfovibrio magneticus str. Maddingley MBC34]|uniref:Uncharacterized protein n=1 Tax=Solidesulfovibrio magneticus str. Maddingley MBC34 TaxID=1206767 RepID=K6GAP4_9BACT|nr:MAG: hypothetical protein B193_3133 [Solidesulfovibrio magneticus str. Maddingley MBC34]